MAVDNYGFITQPDFRGFQPAFSQLVNDVVQTLTATFPDLIHSIYVYGSLIHGTAIEMSSDLDLTVVYYHEPDAAIQIEAVKATLEQNHPVVSKIDIDPGVLEDVMLPANSRRWGYWLKHHCICVYGEDLRDRFEPFRPSREIAVAVNGDFLTVIKGYVALMKPTLEPAERHTLQRAAARKAIRSTNILRTDSDTDWPITLDELRDQFNSRYPALAEEMDYLQSISYRPYGDITAFARRITTFAYWLNAEFCSLQR